MNSLNLPRRELVLAFFFCSALASAQQPEIASVDSSGVQGNALSNAPTVSGDGRFVAFASSANNLVPNDTNNTFDVFVRDTLLSTTTRVSVNSAGQEASSGGSSPMISASGNRVGFDSNASNLALGTFNTLEFYVHDLQTGTTELATVDAQGLPATNVTPGLSVLSADGRHVLFFVDPPDQGSFPPVPGSWYVRDLQAQTTTLLVTNAPSGNPRYGDAMFLGDGRWVAFSRFQPTSASEPGSRVMILDRDSDQNGIFDEPNTIKRKIIQPSQGAPFVRGESSSRNGRFFAYLAATFGMPPYGLWLHDRDPDGDGIFDQPSSAPDTRVALSFDYGNFGTRVPQISDDGRYVAFGDLAPGAFGSFMSVSVVRDMQTGGTFVQAVTPAGDPAQVSGPSAISSDGLSTVVATGSVLVAGDVNGATDVYRIPHDETVCVPPLTYGEATSNSVYAFGAAIHVIGSTRISVDNFTLSTQYVPNGPGQYFYGPDQVSTPFGDGLRLVGGGQTGLIRLPVIQGAGHFATYQMHFGLPPASAGPGHITPGSTWNFQYVFRDPNAGGAGFNTSNAVRVTFCP